VLSSSFKFLFYFGNFLFKKYAVSRQHERDAVTARINSIKTKVNDWKTKRDREKDK